MFFLFKYFRNMKKGKKKILLGLRKIHFRNQLSAVLDCSFISLEVGTIMTAKYISLNEQSF